MVVGNDHDDDGDDQYMDDCWPASWVDIRNWDWNEHDVIQASGSGDSASGSARCDRLLIGFKDLLILFYFNLIINLFTPITKHSRLLLLLFP